MSKLYVAMIGVSGIALGAVAASQLMPDRSQPAGAAPSTAALAFDDSAPLDERLAALETALAAEREARQVLEDEVLLLSERLLTEASPARRSEAIEKADADAETATASETPRRSRSRRGDSEAERRERLVEGGFTHFEADGILRREAEIRMATLEAQYEARRNGEAFDRDDYGNPLRDELGDASYERYLEALGRSTAVTVSNVYESSPALTAGLQPGDQITHYGGRRVFSMNEITAMTLDGTPGEVTTLSILRGGIPMQLSIPRGPMGVVAGRRYRR